MTAPVWVLAEIEGGAVSEATLEALGEAVELARPGRPGVLGVGRADHGPPLAGLAGRGAGRAVLLERGEEPSEPETDAVLAAAWLRTLRSEDEAAPTILLGHTRHGRILAARLAVALDAAMAPDAVAARRTPDGGLDIMRPAYGERFYASVRVPPGVPAVVTLRPRALGVGPPTPAPSLPVERHPAPAPAGVRAARRRRVVGADPRTVDLREAPRIVAGGRGIGGPGGLPLLEELADLLGASIGGSRVAVDLGWLPWERQIGQSGRTVAPRLYVALGISGASQHLAGLQAVETIVAVNADRAAPILGVAHLGVVGDWRPIVTALVDRLRARRAANAGAASAVADGG